VLLAVSPVHVFYSKVAVNDACMTFFVALTMAASVPILRQPGLGNILAAGVCAGLAAGAKYNGGMVLLVPLTALALCAYRERPSFAAVGQQSGLLVLVAAIAFLVSNPYAVLDHSTFLAGFRWQLGLGSAPWPSQAPDFVPSLMGASAVIGFGWLTCLVAVLGAAFLLVDDRQAAILSLLFPCAYILYMSSHALFFDRFLLPIYPAIALLAGYGLHRLSLKPDPKWRTVTVTTITAFAAAVPLADTVLMNRVLFRGETRLSVRQWMAANAPAGSRVLSDWDAAVALWPAGASSLPIVLTAESGDRLAADWPCARLHSEEIEFVLVSEMLTHGVRPAFTARRDELLRCVEREGTLVKTVSWLAPGASSDDVGFFDTLRVRELHGPLIRVFRFDRPKRGGGTTGGS
jgi:4-amino-4-deoxy-L-arabinose transferase-like glycosyltransferase